MRPTLQFGRNRICQVLAVSVVVMLAAFTLIQAAHVHSGGQLENLHCSVCLAAHSAPAIISAPPASPELLLRQESLPAPVCEFKPAVPSFSLFSRPPPNV